MSGGDLWTTRRIGSTTSAVGFSVHELSAAEPGPHLVVLGGVHGDEVGGILAAGSLTRTPLPLVRGRLSVIPIAHEAAHEANQRISPIDQGNLARSFPGNPDGTPTERLADLLYREMIVHADVLIDLHTSMPTADMPLFVGCLDDGRESATRAVALALGFGFDVLWTHPALGPGRTLTAASELDIPALYVESPHGGVINPATVGQYVDGVVSVLEALGVLEPTAPLVPRKTPTRWLHGSGDTDTFTAAEADGLFVREAELLQSVSRGDPVGVVLDVHGTMLQRVLAPRDGLVTTIQTAAAVSAGQTVVGVTAERPTRLGLPSDALFSSAFSGHEFRDVGEDSR